MVFARPRNEDLFAGGRRAHFETLKLLLDSVTKRQAVRNQQMLRFEGIGQIPKQYGLRDVSAPLRPPRGCLI